MVDGRKPKPTALKILQGNPGGRPLTKNEPTPQKGNPRCPSWMPPEGKREWRRLCKYLGEIGMLTKVDGVALAIYCRSWAEFVSLSQFVEENGHRGIRGRSAESLALDSAMTKIIDLGARFGLTPSDRARISLPGKPEEDPFADFLKSGRAKRILGSSQPQLPAPPEEEGEDLEK